MRAKGSDCLRCCSRDWVVVVWRWVQGSCAAGQVLTVRLSIRRSPLQGKGTVKNKRGDLISCLLTFDP